jgi:hypothetical protein
MLNRYFNPPRDVPTLGSELQGTVWRDLTVQLRNDDVLVGLYRNRVTGNLIATHLHSEARFDEMEALYSREGYFAMGLQAANSGMDHKIVPSSD